MQLSILMIVRFLSALLLALLAHTAAYSATDDMRAAAERLVSSQRLDQYWPMIVQNASINGAEKVKLGAFKQIDADPSLNSAQRERAKSAIDKLAPKIAAEVDEMHRKTDAHALALDLVETVYAQYFTAAELQQLAAFYDSAAYQKSAMIGMQVVEESKRTGEDPSVVWSRYEARLTQQDKQAMVRFQNSPLGLKQQRLATKIKQESLAFLNTRTQDTLDAVLKPYFVKLRDGE